MIDNLKTCPEKIYLQAEDNDGQIYQNDITWCVDRIDDNDIEYIRVDIVIAREEAAYQLGLFNFSPTDRPI